MFVFKFFLFLFICFSFSIQSSFANTISSDVSLQQKRDEQVKNTIVSIDLKNNISITTQSDIFKDKVVIDRVKRKIRNKVLETLLDRKVTLSKKNFSNIVILLEGDKINVKDVGIGKDSLTKLINTKLDSLTSSESINTNITIGLDIEFFNEKELLFNKDDIYTNFVLSSYRERNGKNDDSSRKYNIRKAYSIIGGDNSLYVLNKDNTFSYSELIGPYLTSKNFKSGGAIVNGKITNTLGGGLCGGTTGIFQGVLYNGNITYSGRNHTIYYNHLYNSKIQGDFNKIPGLDISYWDGVLDLKLTNTSEYPVLLVNSFIGDIETNFTLDYKKNKNLGTVSFLKKNKKCYSWDRFGTSFSSCYKELH